MPEPTLTRELAKLTRDERVVRFSSLRVAALRATRAGRPDFEFRLRAGCAESRIYRTTYLDRFFCGPLIAT
ncbi:MULTISPECIES: hypothetical protein [unclassified Crossiella]|uniref:hypothetical protein n=1 Tax=unclassified Crossiella TaxID=2620835 RepID=UPI0020001A7A|nr:MULTISPECIES: hypothetical protein [unclassified Crossiella]MCK2239280.1 hypothetical protein [Crossiella sp. S99.2]MCK2251150.1 hypothetical protein [Crossiella sp. S99.1]